MRDPHLLRISPRSELTLERVRDARARAWRYVFDCFNRRNGQEGGPTTAPDSAKGGSQNDSSAKTIIPESS
jgi:hypothetical protein